MASAAVRTRRICPDVRRQRHALPDAVGKGDEPDAILRAQTPQDQIDGRREVLHLPAGDAAARVEHEGHRQRQGFERDRVDRLEDAVVAHLEVRRRQPGDVAAAVGDQGIHADHVDAAPERLLARALGARCRRDEREHQRGRRGPPRHERAIFRMRVRDRDRAASIRRRGSPTTGRRCCPGRWPPAARPAADWRSPARCCSSLAAIRAACAAGHPRRRLRVPGRGRFGVAGRVLQTAEEERGEIRHAGVRHGRDGRQELARLLRLSALREHPSEPEARLQPIRRDRQRLAQVRFRVLEGLASFAGAGVDRGGSRPPSLR